MSPNHGCLAVGMGGHLPGHMRPVPPISGQGCLAIPDRRAHHLAQGDLEALWEGLLGGAFMRMGTIGRKPGKDVFLLLVYHGGFLWACYQLRTAEDPFGYAIEWKLKPQ